MMPAWRPRGLFRCVLVAQTETARDWHSTLCEWLFISGCRYLVAWGDQCEEWHDTMDAVNIAAFPGGEIPDDKFVMTTWHDAEPMREAFWFSRSLATHPHVKLGETLLLHIAPTSAEAHMLSAYADAKD
jgi:hypothetical protein